MADNPSAHTEYVGRRWTVEVELYLPVNATEQQMEEAFEFAVGGGSIASDHPLIDEPWERVQVIRAVPHRDHLYTDWQACEADGSRKGRSRFERDGDAARMGGTDNG